MKRLTIALAAIAIALTNCKKDHNQDTSTNSQGSVQKFDIIFNGTEYTGANVRYGVPAQHTTTYRTELECTLAWTPAFYVRIANAPTSGKADFCNAGCDPQNGDIILSFLGDGVMETEFSGSMEYTTDGIVKINAVSKTGKTLTGTIQWK
ncbi:hypothetical protein [Pinibacter aurantiacus]|uniref:Uncharacterized protein n=1 Tax=Pinibacter aurantiacus TaxID=2851599 RepID=A0A9E2S6S9_9BACT|nr:hypothetical protein [Pinibacter aurantiacus]MBV4356831.1 hypothetical protein [Pinibacter aurantiacus]